MLSNSYLSDSTAEPKIRFAKENAGGRGKTLREKGLEDWIQSDSFTSFNTDKTFRKCLKNSDISPLKRECAISGSKGA